MQCDVIRVIFAYQTKLNISRKKRATKILPKRLHSHFKLSLQCNREISLHRHFKQPGLQDVENSSESEESDTTLDSRKRIVPVNSTPKFVDNKIKEVREAVVSKAKRYGSYECSKERN
jgi:hypothetical protein